MARDATAFGDMKEAEPLFVVSRTPIQAALRDVIVGHMSSRWDVGRKVSG